MKSDVLLADLRALVRRLEVDLAEQAKAVPKLATHLEGEYQKARAAERTAEPFETFRDGLLTQSAVAWVLAAVFVRFLEDNGFLDGALLPGDPATAGREKRRLLAGASPELLALARRHEARFVADQPLSNERDYVQAVFTEVEKLPGMADLLSHEHNPLWSLPISPDGARDVLELFRRIEPATGRVVHAFESRERETRFLGDLYQDLSEAARKRYALLQTPDFVEELLLDRTLTPAIEEHGAAAVRLIDPACGSGHFLLGAFRRLYAHALARDPGGNPRALAQAVLHQLAGVDLNPFAAAIARFRLLVAALTVAEVERLADAPAFYLPVAAGDSLLHGTRSAVEGGLTNLPLFGRDVFAHCFESEDAVLLRKLLSQRYHVVVGNPPYITVKDKAASELYRQRYPMSCHRQYSLVCPFLERFFDLAIRPQGHAVAGAGYVGAIVANSFMKREFGKKLVEGVLSRLDLAHVIDTSGAYIPGHGTPTVILIGRHRVPIAATVRAVLGIRGEPGTPEDPARGKVWSAIVEQMDRPGSESEFVSVVDAPRATFSKHPWSLGGGGAQALLARLRASGSRCLEESVLEVGRTTHTGEDEAFFLPVHAARIKKLESICVPLVTGEVIRDFGVTPDLLAVFPYETSTGESLAAVPEILQLHFWPLRTSLRRRIDFGQTPEERGLHWWDHSMFFPRRYRVPLSITFAFVATHNHFVLDRGGKVFNRSAPVIKLAPEASKEDHLALLGVLNSSTACFWMKQVFHNKGARGQGGGFTSQEWEQFYEHDGTKLLQFPLPLTRPTDRARALDALAQEISATTPAALAARETPTADGLTQARARYEALRRQAIAQQEELDWHTYALYHLLPEELTYSGEDLPEVALGERAFEIALARRLAAGDEESQWFARHGSMPRTEIPNHFPAAYRALLERRLEAIAAKPEIALIERPEYKRRWNAEPWQVQEERALRQWLLDRLEAPEIWREGRLTSTARLADHLRRDPDFAAVAALYRRQPSFDWARLVAELVEDEGVPYLAALRYSASGLEKRAIWERTWEAQRREDAIDHRTTLPEGHPERLTAGEAAAEKARAVGQILVPPKYGSGDFKSGTIWSLRGKLDVPKERFITYPGAERGADPSPVVGWAGWDHAQQALALAHYTTDMRTREAWPRERLTPLFAGLAELLPWLRQWHNQPNPQGAPLADFYTAFLEEETKSLGLTFEDLRNWRPEAKARRRRA